MALDLDTLLKKLAGKRAELSLEELQAETDQMMKVVPDAHLEEMLTMIGMLFQRFQKEAKRRGIWDRFVKKQDPRYKW